MIKAEYRGTSVAVKRVIPPKGKKNRESIFDFEATPSQTALMTIDNLEEPAEDDDIVVAGEEEDAGSLTPETAVHAS